MNADRFGSRSILKTCAKSSFIKNGVLLIIRSLRVCKGVDRWRVTIRPFDRPGEVENEFLINPANGPAFQIISVSI